MLTCKQFLQELNEYLDETIDPATKSHLIAHVNECPNCFVIVDTTMKTLKVYKGMDPQPVPEDLKARLWAAVERRIEAKRKAQASQTHPQAKL